MADGRDLGFGPPGNCAIRSADLENPRTKHEVDRMTRCRDMAVEIFQNARSVGRSSVLNIYIDVMYSSSLR